MALEDLKPLTKTPSLSFIHTADLHLGKSFQQLGQSGAGLRRRVLAAYGRIIDAALDRQADLVVIAGDLFDAPAPPREALAALAAGFGRLAAAGTRVVAIPGTHDPWGAWAYSDRVVSAWPPNVFLLSPQRRLLEFAELDLAVAAFLPSRERAGDWLAPPEGWGAGRAFRVALIHGSVMSGLDHEGPEDLIPSSILVDRSIHYLALGHHHGCREVSRAGPPAYYSGSPEPLAIDQREAGRALHVLLRQSGAGVETLVTPIQVGVLRSVRLELEPGELLAGRDLARELEALADPDVYLEVRIKGRRPIDAPPWDLDELLQVWAGRFFKLKIVDRSEPGRELAELGESAEISARAEFARRMRQKLEAATGEERREWEDALRLGLEALAGGGGER